MKKAQSWTFSRLLWTGFSVRMLLVFYAKIHDHLFDVNFTDIDYRVFSDAAELVFQGKSPYDRPTYRYTPLLAWLLLPNVFFPDFGKVLFCLVDVATAWLLYKLCPVGNGLPNSKQELQKQDSRAVWNVCLLWLFNPFICIISARGNADSMVCAAVLLSLYLLNNNYRPASAIIHGAVAVHLKVYPIIYLPSIFFSFIALEEVSFTFAGLKQFIWRCLSNKHGFIYVMLSVLFFFNTITLGYLVYNTKFVEEFLLYHISRKDIRHNFSPYFYPLYLVHDNAYVTRVLSMGAFLPQLACILLFALKYRKDLPFCWFLTTYSFVSFNKVCTSQYFIWYLCFLPLIWDKLKISTRETFQLAVLWLAGQAVWLLPAYLFEFQGYDTLLLVWIASLIFLFINCYNMKVLMCCYEEAGEKLVESAKKIR